MVFKYSGIFFKYSRMILLSLCTIVTSGTTTIPRESHIGQTITIPIPNLRKTDIVYTALRNTPSVASFIATSMNNCETPDASLQISSGAVGLSEELVISYLILRA